MKNWLRKTLILLCTVSLFTVAGALIGCGGCKDDSCKHSWGEGTITRQATCTERGITTYTCTKCGDTKEEPISPRHTFVDEVTDPTCTEDGYTTHVCQNCEYERVDTIVEAVGHNYQKSSTQATCEEDGYDVYTCDCGDSYSDVTQKSTGHNTTGVVWTVYGEDVLVDEDTCTYERTEKAQCKTCSNPVYKTYTVEKHVYETSVSAHATCVSEGTKTHTCKNCGDSQSEDIAINANAHDWDDGVEGNGVKVYTCKHDGSHTKQEIVLAQGDTATVPAEAKQADVELKMDNATMKMDETLVEKLTGDVELTAGKFEQTDAAVSEAVDKMDPADKERLGSSEIFSFGLTNNGQPVDFEGGKMTVSVPYNLQDGDDPDCIAIWFIDDDGSVSMISATYANGFATFETEHFSLYTVVRMTAKERCAKYGYHQYVDQVVAPTCTEEGYTLHTCKICRDTKRDTFVDAIGHNYTANVVAPTCSDMGYTRNSCSNCHDTYISNRTQKLEHSYQTEVVAPSCLLDGYTMQVCEHCHKTNVMDFTDKLGHDYKDGKCSACGVRDPNASTSNNNFYVNLFNSIKDKSSQFYVEIAGVEFYANGPVDDDYDLYLGYDRQETTATIDSGKFTFTIGENGMISGKGELMVTYTIVTSASVSPVADRSQTYVNSVKFVMQDGAVYYVTTTTLAGEVRTDYNYEPMSESSMNDAMTSLVDQVLSAIDENVHTIIDKLITTSGSPTEAHLKRVIEYFFDKTETEKGYDFAFNFDVIPEIYQTITTSSVAELFDIVYGEGKFQSIVTWLKSSLDKTMPQVITELGVETLKSGLDIEDVYDLIDEILVVTETKNPDTGKQMTVKQILSMPEFKSTTLRNFLDMAMGEGAQGVNYVEMIDGFAMQLQEMSFEEFVSMIVQSMGGSGDVAPEGGVTENPVKPNPDQEDKDYPDENEKDDKEEGEKEETRPTKPMSAIKSVDPILAMLEDLAAAFENTIIGFTTDKLGSIQSIALNVDVEEFALDLGQFVVEGTYQEIDYTFEITASGSVEVVFGASYVTEYKDLIAKVQAGKNVINMQDGQTFSDGKYVVVEWEGVKYIVGGEKDTTEFYRHVLNEAIRAYLNNEKDLDRFWKHLSSYGIYNMQVDTYNGKPCFKFDIFYEAGAYMLKEDGYFTFCNSCVDWVSYYTSCSKIFTVNNVWITFEANNNFDYGFSLEVVNNEIDWGRTLEYEKIDEHYGFNFFYNTQTQEYKVEDPHAWVFVSKYTAKRCGEYTYELWKCTLCDKTEKHNMYYKDHAIETTFVLAQGAQTCEDGVVCIQTCENCDYEKRVSVNDIGNGDHPCNVYSEKVATTACGHVYLVYAKCPCGKTIKKMHVSGECCFDKDAIVEEKVESKMLDGVLVQEYISTVSICPVYGCGAAYRLEKWYVYDGCTRMDHYRYTFGLQSVNEEIVEGTLVVKTFEMYGGIHHHTELTVTADNNLGLDYVETSTCRLCHAVEYKQGWTTDSYGRVLRHWDYLSQTGMIYEYEGCYATAYLMKADGSYGDKQGGFTSHYTHHVELTQSCTQYEVWMEYCVVCQQAVEVYEYGRPSGHDYYWNEEKGLHECARCGMESKYPANGNFYLEDLTGKVDSYYSDETVVGFFNNRLENWDFTVIVNYNPEDGTGVELLDFDGYEVIYYTGDEPFSWMSVRCGMVYVDDDAVREAIAGSEALQGVTVESVSLVFEYQELVWVSGSKEPEIYVYQEAVTIFVADAQ